MTILGSLYRAARPVLFATFPPEIAHGLTLTALKKGFMPSCGVSPDPSLRVTLWGRNFPSPIGMAAGFDKDAVAIASLLRLGFGFVEVGTVTPRSQEGNPKPRIFREPRFESVINRMGFPGAGVSVFKENLARFLALQPRPMGVVGVNIGMNKGQTDPAQDYCALIRTLGPMADYLVVNISSPNTPGLRNLQEPEALAPLLEALMKERTKSCGAHPPPLLVKFSPDMTPEQEEGIVPAIRDSGIEGIILTNTTLDRPSYLSPRFAQQGGGLSGTPLRDRATDAIRRFYKATKGKLPIIGVGGVDSAQTAWEKIRAGASLVQLYTGFVYQGPWIAADINRDLVHILRAHNMTHISQAVGTEP